MASHRGPASPRRPLVKQSEVPVWAAASETLEGATGCCMVGRSLRSSLGLSQGGGGPHGPLDKLESWVNINEDMGSSHP